MADVRTDIKQATLDGEHHHATDGEDGWMGWDGRMPLLLSLFRRRSNMARGTNERRNERMSEGGREGATFPN